MRKRPLSSHSNVMPHRSTSGGDPALSAATRPRCRPPQLPAPGEVSRIAHARPWATCLAALDVANELGALGVIRERRCRARPVLGPVLGPGARPGRIVADQRTAQPLGPAGLLHRGRPRQHIRVIDQPEEQVTRWRDRILEAGQPPARAMDRQGGEQRPGLIGERAEPIGAVGRGPQQAGEPGAPGGVTGRRAPRRTAASA